MSNVIYLSKYRPSEKIISTESMSDRMLRIRASLERINRMMREVKGREHYD